MTQIILAPKPPRRDMTDESGAKERARMIEKGQITPDAPKRYLSREQAESLRRRLIKEGVIKPAAMKPDSRLH